MVVVLLVLDKCCSMCACTTGVEHVVVEEIKNFDCCDNPTCDL